MKLALGLVCFSVFSCRAILIPGDARVKGVGVACLSETECRAGLTCKDGTCQPSASLQKGAKCDLTEACAAGLYCSQMQVCDTAGTNAAGEICGSSADCARPLFCGFAGTFPICTAAGTGDLGATCSTAKDCLAGLGCAGGVCAAGAPTLTVPIFAGVDCPDDSGAFRAYFQVPAPGEALPDFFRLPFPNEARNGGDAGLNLTGFPRPPDGPIGDLLAQYVDAARSETGAGWGTNQPITLRTSQSVNGSTLSYNEPLVSDGFGGMVDPSTIFLFELQRVASNETVSLDGPLGCDTRQDMAGWRTAPVPGVVEWLVGPARTPYVCQNSISFRLRTDSTLKRNALYMFVLTTSVRSTADQAMQPDADLTSLLSSTPPTAGDRLSRPYACYGPARAILGAAAAAVPTNKVAALTLFHTQDTVEPAAAVIRGVAAAPVEARPKITKLVKCAPGVTSPCADASDQTRACPGTTSASYDEFHGQMTVPVMQVGARPYDSSGGYIEYTDGITTRRFAHAPSGAITDAAKVQGAEQVCFAVSVPKNGLDGTGKATGIVIYGHGTGGNFRSFFDEGQLDANGALIPSKTLATDFADATPSLAIFSFDQSMHGPRRNSVNSPDILYFNVNNPRAMRDNALQGVADYEQVLATLQGITAGTGVFATDLDAALVTEFRSHLAGTPRVFLGHSQGGTNGVPWIALTKGADVLGALLSGTGGGLTESLLNKVQPVNFREKLPLALQDPGLSHFHPVLSLIQMVGERADPINYGEVMNGRAAVVGGTGPSQFARSLFHMVGVADTFTPLRTSSDLSHLMHIPVFAVDASVEATNLTGGFEPTKGTRTDPLKLLTSDTGSASGLLCNCTQSGMCTTSSSSPANFTAATVVYKPETNADGHFVLFQSTQARAQAKKFLQTSAGSLSGFCAPTGATTFVSPVIPPP